MITVTLAKIDGVAITADSRGLDRDMLLEPPRPLVIGDDSSACLVTVGLQRNGLVVAERWQLTGTFTAIVAALTTDAAESGAEVTTNKVTSLSGASTDVQYPSAKLAYDQLALKAPLASPTFTGVPAAPTAATATSTTQVATTAFVQANFVAKVAKTSSGALVAGVRIIADALITANSAVSVQKISLGGTYAPGYKVTLSAGVGFTITALQSDGATTEILNTDLVMATIVY